MKLCITCTGKHLQDRLDTRFGRAPYFLLVDTESLNYEAIENPAGDTGQGAGIRAAQVMVDRGVNALLTGVVGPNAGEALQAAGIKVYEGAAPGDSAEEAIEKFKKGMYTVASFHRPERGGCGPGPGRGGRTRQRLGKMPGVTSLPPGVIADFHRKNFSSPVIGITSGKGGVGKTSVAVNLACAIADSGKKVALIDADVDAPNAALLLGATLENHEAVATTIPEANGERCTACGKCIEACRNNALFLPKGGIPLLLGQCNGCEACFLVCREEALIRKHRTVGGTYRTELGALTLFTGELIPTAEESAEVVKAVKARAFAQAAEYDYLIIDTSPGTHCNVIFALQGADLVLAVTEPSPLGMHDLDLILSLLDIFAMPSWVVANRTETSETGEALETITTRHTAPLAAILPFDENLLQSYVEATPLVRMYPESKSAGIFFDLAKAVAVEFAA